MNADARQEILERYAAHARRFDDLAARRIGALPGDSEAEIIRLPSRVPELEQEPSAREVQVLQLISDGLSNKEVGARLFVSEETVKSHVRHLLAKLQARSRAHAVTIGFRRGIVV